MSAVVIGRLPTAQDRTIGHREYLALRMAAKDGILYVGGYGMLFEAAMVCVRLNLLEHGHRASKLTLTPKGAAVLLRAGSDLKEDGWTLEVA